jgi:hypothetical protein
LEPSPTLRLLDLLLYRSLSGRRISAHGLMQEVMVGMVATWLVNGLFSGSALLYIVV